MNFGLWAMAPSPGALLYWLLAATWPSSPTWELQPAIGRHQRRLLTRILNSSWTREATAWDPVECLGLWSRPQPQLKNRRPRRLFLRKSGRMRWSGWPPRGKRIGEAANPGPPAPGTPVGGERPYGRRPLEERPSMDSMQHGVHPSCRPAAREAVADPGGVREGDALPLPTFDEIQAGRTPTLRHVPGRARWLWARALTRAFAAVVHYNDERSWRELYMLPQCVLDPPARGGKKHAKAAAAYTLDRLKRWEDALAHQTAAATRA